MPGNQNTTIHLVKAFSIAVCKEKSQSLDCCTCEPCFIQQPKHDSSAFFIHVIFGRNPDSHRNMVPSQPTKDTVTKSFQWPILQPSDLIFEDRGERL